MITPVRLLQMKLQFAMGSKHGAQMTRVLKNVSQLGRKLPLNLRDMEVKLLNMSNIVRNQRMYQNHILNQYIINHIS